MSKRTETSKLSLLCILSVDIEEKKEIVKILFKEGYYTLDPERLKGEIEDVFNCWIWGNPEGGVISYSMTLDWKDKILGKDFIKAYNNNEYK